jgi:hypothetical protein
MVAAILACEVGFWVVLLSGLSVRYLIGLRRTGAVLLAATPLVDLALLIFTVVHLRSGAEAQAADGLAAVYLGVSIAFGHRTLRWADARFAHRFGGGPTPPRPPKGGPEHARRQRGLWYLHLLAFAIGSALLAGGSLLVGEADGADALVSWIPRWGAVLAVDFVWSFSYTLWPRRQAVP